MNMDKPGKLKCTRGSSSADPTETSLLVRSFGRRQKIRCRRRQPPRNESAMPAAAAGETREEDDFYLKRVGVSVATSA